MNSSNFFFSSSVEVVLVGAECSTYNLLFLVVSSIRSFRSVVHLVVCFFVGCRYALTVRYVTRIIVAPLHAPSE